FLLSVTLPQPSIIFSFLSFTPAPTSTLFPYTTLFRSVQKRTAVAMALATEPELLLLDEPAGGIPEEETADFANLIRSLPQRGVSVLLVEHKMSMIMGLADTILVLDHGQKLALGTPEEIQSNPEVIRAYLGSTTNEEN